MSVNKAPFYFSVAVSYTNVTVAAKTGTDVSNVEQKHLRVVECSLLVDKHLHLLRNVSTSMVWLGGAPAHKDGVGVLDNQGVDGIEKLVSLSCAYQSL